jgi:hypothetical protein
MGSRNKGQATTFGGILNPFARGTLFGAIQLRCLSKASDPRPLGRRPRESGMRLFIAAASILLTVILAPFGTFASEYVDTSGHVIKKEDLAIYCRPTKTLGDGRLMVYSTSRADGNLLKKHMIESGVTDEPTLRRWLKMAADDDCTKRAGLNCSDGTCSKGSCQEEKKGDFKGCACK